MTPPVAESVDATADLLGALGSHMSALERDRFALDLAEAIRTGDRSAYHRVLTGWKLSLALRETPGYEEQYKEFVRVREVEGISGVFPGDPAFPNVL